MMWQRCPICDGAGYTGVGFPTGVACGTCEGKRIINTITGFPPAGPKIVTTTGTSLEEIERAIKGSGNE